MMLRLHAIPLALLLAALCAHAPVALASGSDPDLHDWRFDDPAGTELSQTLNSSNPAVRWSGNLANSTTTGSGVFRIRRNGAAQNRRADVSATQIHPRLRMTVEIAGWDLRHTTGSQPGIRFDFMNGPAADLPSEVTAGFRLDRLSNGAVTLQAVASGTASPGAEQSATVPLFSSLQTEKLTIATLYDGSAHRYSVQYRLGDGPWVEFFRGNTSGVRQAISFRMLVTGDFDGQGQNRFDLDRFSVATDPGGLPDLGISTGNGYFEYHFAARNVIVPVWTYLPPNAPADPPIVIVCHGLSRNASGNRNSWRTHADRLGFLVVAPEFTDQAFPGSNFYNLGNRFSSGVLNPQAVWSFQVIEELFDEVRQRLPSTRETYHLYGHSAGSQFVHRMLWFMPDLRVDRAVMANAGWYTMPDIFTEYPHGFRNSHYSTATVAERLSQRHLVLLGTNDTDPNDPDLSTHPLSMAQGPHRFARGNRFYDTSEHVAGLLGVDFGWSLGYAPDVGHSNAGMAAFAANWLFDAWSGRASLLYNVPEQEYRQELSAGLPAPDDHNAAWFDNYLLPGIHVQFSQIGIPERYRIGATSAPGTLQHWRATDTSTTGMLGARPDDTTGDIHYGLRLTNNTGRPLFGFTLRYTGVQFFNSHSGSLDALHVSWRTGPPGDLLTGTWHHVPALTFHAPHAGDGVSPPAELNPQLSANRRVIGPLAVTGPVWLPGQDLWIRWTHPNKAGANHGLGLDQIRLSAAAVAPVAPPFIVPPSLTTHFDESIEITLSESHYGYAYQVQESTDLVTWENAAQLQDGSGQPLKWEFPLTGERRFFRIVRENR